MFDDKKAPSPFCTGHKGCGDRHCDNTQDDCKECVKEATDAIEALNKETSDRGYKKTKS